MNSLRESIASIPGALTSFISESASIYTYIHGNNATPAILSSSNTSTPSQTASNSDGGGSTVTHSESSLPIPAALVKEQWRLIFTSDANAKDLQEAIEHCRDLILLTDECSEERKWLVRHLVDLRYSLKELEEAEKDPNESGPSVKTVVGHHFVTHQHGGGLQAAATRNYCDHCSGIIWSVVQTAYICTDCRFLVHQKCVDSVVRVCVHIVAMERQYPIAEICPEVGLAAQLYKCAECEALLNHNSTTTVKCFGQKAKGENSWIEPRLCDYSGLYYCPSCHWNDSSIIPARIVHNWDFSLRKVSRSSLQEINLFLDMPLIKLEEANPKLFVFLEKLFLLKKLRQNLVYMRKYLIECREAIEEKVVENQIGTHRHLIQSTEFFSINDLEQTECGELDNFLNKVYTAFDKHIRGCSRCTAKAYICEICSNVEVIFPFDDGCILCGKCNSIFHRVCLTRKNMICPKCVRVQERQVLLQAENSKTDEDDND